MEHTQKKTDSWSLGISSVTISMSFIRNSLDFVKSISHILPNSKILKVLESEILLNI